MQVGPCPIDVTSDLLAGHFAEGFLNSLLLVKVLPTCESIQLVLLVPLLDDVEGLLDGLVGELVALVEDEPNIELLGQVLDFRISMH